MAKAIQHRLLIHGSFNQHDMGIFESKAAAKRYLSECGNDKPYTLVPVIESPAPTDWGKEAVNLDKMVEQAENQIKNLLSPDGGAVQINAESYQLVWRKGEAVYVTHSYTTSRGKTSLNGIAARSIFLILDSLQKAIAGGTGK